MLKVTFEKVHSCLEKENATITKNAKEERILKNRKNKGYLHGLG